MLMDMKAERLTITRMLRDSALELLLTFLMLFGVTSIVRWVIGPSPISRAIPQIQVELLIVGLAVAILIAGLISSPPGRSTGGHMNPAISLAMWRFGVFPGVGVVPYIVAQLLGSVLGVVIAGVGVLAGAAFGLIVARVAGSYFGDLKMPGALPVIVSALVLLGAAVVASMLPAARAARVDVMQALRSE